MKLAIVGSRFVNAEKVRDHLLPLVSELKPELIVSGGARGADRAGELIADTLDVPKLIHHAEWERFGRSAGMRRNGLIVRDCDQVLAVFVSGVESRGTANTVSRARKAGKPVHEVTVPRSFLTMLK